MLEVRYLPFFDFSFGLHRCCVSTVGDTSDCVTRPVPSLLLLISADPCLRTVVRSENELLDEQIEFGMVMVWLWW